MAGLDDRAGLEQLRVAAPLPQPRRRRAALARERAGAGAGQRLVPRPARLHRRPALYGDERGGFAQLEIGYGDGHRQVVVTDTTWQAGPSATTANDLYDGQTVDARRCPSAVEWVGVHALDFDASLLAPSATPPIRRHEALRPERIWTSPSGRTLLDFGANIVGWLRFTVQGEAGDEITLRHAEMLEDGELGTRPLRTARATDRLILSGGRDTFEPTFTTHGFRYAEVTGWSGELNAHDIEAVVVHTDLPRTGHFACSDPLLDQLHANVVRSLRGNAVGLPTDCPQRDERLGWTGDLAVFAPTAVFLYDMSAFLGDWLVDLALEQEHAEGRVPLVVPDCLKYAEMPPDLPTPDSVAIWSDAAVWVPWALWEAYGDDEVLRAQWPSMLAHVDRVAARLSDRDLWETGFQFGDWLDPRAPPDDPFASRADNGVVATACFFRTLTMTAATAGVLRRPDEAARLTGLAARVRTAFATHDVDGDGRILSDCPTADALAIVFGLLDGEPRQQAGDRLADPVTMGASTIWERWDSMLPDGSVNPGEMTSFNHYALGAVVDWMHRTVGGIAPLGPGYRRILVAPRPGGGLTWADTTLETPHGQVRVAWRAEGSELVDLDVTVPPGCTAVVRWPDAATTELSAGRYTGFPKALRGQELP